jgi:hypothetical protein
MRLSMNPIVAVGAATPGLREIIPPAAGSGGAGVLRGGYGTSSRRGAAKTI